MLAALLGDEPGNAAVQHRLGMVRAALGDFDAAIAHMVRAVALDPVPAVGWANLGMLLKVQGRFEESLDAYGEALLRAPHDAAYGPIAWWRCCMLADSPRHGATMHGGSRWLSVLDCRVLGCCRHSPRWPVWQGAPCC